MIKLNKKIRKELRQLSHKAYQRQLDQKLSELAENFDDWRNKKIDCFELGDKIHQFHDGPARDLWKRYSYSSDILWLVAAAFDEGHIQESEISEETLKEIRGLLSLYAGQADE